MKYNKKDNNKKKRYTFRELLDDKPKDPNDIEQVLDARERKIKRNEIVALAMLVTGLIAGLLSLRILDHLYKTYTLMETSTLYEGLRNRDAENDTLSDVQQIMNEIENIYEASYVNEIKRDHIDEMVCNALVQAYGDKYAVYRNSEESEFTANSLDSKISGVGILTRVEQEDDEPEFAEYIIDVYENSPAEKAGIKKGWKIVKVNGKELDKNKYTYDEVIDDIRGEEGTTVKLTLMDENGKLIEKTVERKKTKTVTVRYEKVADDIGYIKIRNFEGDTSSEFKEAVEYFKSQGIDKFIFDMRDNSGGLKESVVDMLDYLLPEGLIIDELNSKGEVVDTTKSDKNHVEFTSMTLINDGTASAAELFTKCLVDYDKTTTIGKKSFGKGTVCTSIPLTNGGSLMLSTGRYLTKSKEDIEGEGITPDIKLDLPKDKKEIDYKLPIDEDDIIQRAIKELQKQ